MNFRDFFQKVFDHTLLSLANSEDKISHTKTAVRAVLATYPMPTKALQLEV